jgi:hypothetical protein
MRMPSYDYVVVGGPPRLADANTNATVIAIAERAAALIGQ